jgi:two-component system response regulator HydG
MRVLIVEDEPLISLLLEELIETSGHPVAGVAVTLSQARAIMAAQDLDIAFLDLFLQGQETSVELSRELAEKAIPVLFVTGNEQECRNHQARAVGYIEKPFGRRTMIAALDLVEALREGKPLPAEDPDGLILFRQQHAA